MNNNKMGSTFLWVGVPIWLVLCLAAVMAFARAEDRGKLLSQPKKMEKVRPGDCAGCHRGKNVLSKDHVSTINKRYSECKECHFPPPCLRGKIPLSHIHHLNGINCRDCHKNSRYKEPLTTPNCLSCHKGYEKLVSMKVEGVPNPHNSHYGNMDCEVCHHHHRLSENFCAKCHQWSLVVP